MTYLARISTSSGSVGTYLALKISVTSLPACCVNWVGSLPLYPDTVFDTMPSGLVKASVANKSGSFSVTSFMTSAQILRARDLPASDSVFTGSRYPIHTPSVTSGE
ncbi:hypothetical protein D3C74_345470 [compost metagenome]